MKKSVLIGIVFGAVLSVLLAGAAREAPGERGHNVMDNGPEHHLVYRAGEIEWSEGPASLEPGAMAAVLEGDPGEPGFFNLRLKLPDGFQIAPHWHPNVERLTVISGTFLLGSGEKVDQSAVERLEPGSYTSMPPGMRHFAIAEGETVVQLTSLGPWKIHYVNPKDDPRLRKN